MNKTEPIRNKKHVAQLIMYYFNRGQMRNYLLITLCLHTALRISDVLNLTTSDVYDFKKNRIRNSITITEQKTGKSKEIALHKNVIKALKAFFLAESSKTITKSAETIKSTKPTKSINSTKTGKTAKNGKITVIPGISLIRNERTDNALSRVQAYRIVQAAGEGVGLTQKISCHSLRKTFGYHAWKDGVSPAVIMEIFNHSSLKITQRYLGVHQDDINNVYLGLSFS